MNPNKLETYKVEPDDDFNFFDRNKSFEQIKTPAELFGYMHNNIKYGFVDKNNHKIYSPQQEGWGVGDAFPRAYYLQAPEELLASQHGTCWDQTELERSWFSKHNYEFKTFILMFGREISQKNPAHTFLAYQDKNKWNWFENTLDERNNGIHQFENFDDLVAEVKNIITNNAINNGATEEDLKKINFCEYEAPAAGCNSDKFINNIINRYKSGD